MCIRDRYKVRKTWSTQAAEYLDALRERSRQEQSDQQERAMAAKQRAMAAKLLAEVRVLGRVPREHAPSDDPGRKAERTLARDLREARAAGSFNEAQEEELEELEAREREAYRVYSLQRPGCQKVGL